MTAFRPDRFAARILLWNAAFLAGAQVKRGARMHVMTRLTLFPGWRDYKYLFFRRQATSSYPPLYCNTEDAFIKMRRDDAVDGSHPRRRARIDSTERLYIWTPYNLYPGKWQL